MDELKNFIGDPATGNVVLMLMFFYLRRICKELDTVKANVFSLALQQSADKEDLDDAVLDG